MTRTFSSLFLAVISSVLMNTVCLADDSIDYSNRDLTRALLTQWKSNGRILTSKEFLEIIARFSPERDRELKPGESPSQKELSEENEFKGNLMATNNFLTEIATQTTNFEILDALVRSVDDYSTRYPNTSTSPAVQEWLVVQKTLHERLLYLATTQD